MKIALFTESYYPIVNGVTVAVATLRRELLNLGNEVCLFAPHFPGHEDTESSIFRFPSVCLPTNPRYPISLPILNSGLVTAIENFKPDIIHTHSLFGMGQAAQRIARHRKIPLILTYHTLIEAYTHYIPLPQPFVRFAARKLSRNRANRAAVVIAPGFAALDTLRAYGVTSPIEVIPTGIDFSLFSSLDGSLTPARFAIPEDALIIASAGRIAIEKNLELLLEVFPRLEKDFPTAHLLFIGGGPWQEHIKSAVNTQRLSHKIHISGFLPREQLLALLTRCHIFVFPSLTDTQGIAVMEAMACGLPVVASNTDAVKGVVNDSEEGCVVPATVEAFRTAISRLLTDPHLRQTMGQAGIQKAKEFSAVNCALKVLEIYQRAINNRLQV